MDGRIPTMASATYNTPLWQRGASTPTTYANEPTSPTSVGGSADANTPVGFEGHPQVQVGKPENAWRYEMRREAQLILPNLYLGGYQSSRTVDGLNALGVTHVVCVREETEAMLVKPRFPDLFQYLVLEVADTEDQNLIRLFPSTCDWIARAIAGGGTVLVHCSGGIALAPSIVCGYVMLSQRWTFEEAVRWTQQRRYCMSLNIGFLNQLREYEPFCRASVALPPSSGADGSKQDLLAGADLRPRKRSGDALSEDDGDDDHEMDGGDGGDDNENDRGDPSRRRPEAKPSIDPATGRPEHRPVRRVQRLDS